MKSGGLRRTEEGIITYNADFVKISSRKEAAGYACIGTYDHYKDITLEYYLISKYRANSADVIRQLIKRNQIIKYHKER